MTRVEQRVGARETVLSNSWRGHLRGVRLATELRAMFRDDPRVQVIENRREDHALLPRSATVTRHGLPAG